MIVQCPNCSTKYNFDEARFKNDVKVRCTKCQHVFKVSLLSDEDDYPGFSLDTSRTGDDSPPEAPQWDPEDMNVDIEPGEKPKKGIRKILLLLAGTFFLVLLGLLIYFLLPEYGNNLNIPFMPSEEKQETTDKQEFTEEDVKNISLENIRQYFVSNDKIGQLFVIEGQAINNFQEPKSMIKLKASLYDAAGEVVQEKEFLCGNAASLFQLQVSSEEELESTLTSRLGVLTTNKHLDPGSHTPFMVVFYNPPETVQEFGLEVTEAHDPPS
ncbi:MAG: DUF3426 domain-containing protein [Desulfonatronovibrionaceae bacterium]